MKFRVGVRSLTNACLNAREDERRIVKAIQGSGLALFLYRLLRKLCARADCPKIRHYPENSLGLLLFSRVGWSDLARRTVGGRGALRSLGASGKSEAATICREEAEAGKGTCDERLGRRQTQSTGKADDRDAHTDGGCQIPAPLRTCHCSDIRLSLTLASTQQERAFSDFGATTAGSVARTARLT